jgi:hypothetical protein
MGIDSPVSMDWSSRTSPSVMLTSAATTAPSESFTTSPGTRSEAGHRAPCVVAAHGRIERKPRPQGGKRRLGAPFLDEAEGGVEDQERKDDRRLDVLSEEELQAPRPPQASMGPAPRTSPMPCERAAHSCRGLNLARTSRGDSGPLAPLDRTGSARPFPREVNSSPKVCPQRPVSASRDKPHTRPCAFGCTLRAAVGISAIARNANPEHIPRSHWASIYGGER